MLIYEVKFCVQNLADFHEIDMKWKSRAQIQEKKHIDSNIAELAFITQSKTYR